MKKRWGRVLLFLILNVIVSALTMWVVLTIWGRTVLVNQPVILPGAIGVDNGAGQNDTASDVIESHITLTEIGADDFENERIQLKYTGEELLQLQGWELHDEDGHIYIFPNISLFSMGTAVDVYSKHGANGISELFWGADGLIWEPGELVTLFDAEGQVRATYTVP